MPGATPRGWDISHLPCGRDTGGNTKTPAGALGRGEQNAHHQEGIDTELMDPLAEPELHIVWKEGPVEAAPEPEEDTGCQETESQNLESLVTERKDLSPLCSCALIE